MSYLFQDDCDDEFNAPGAKCSRRPSYGPIVRPNRKACFGGHGLEHLYRGDERPVFHGTVVAMVAANDTLPGEPRQVTRTFKAPFARASHEDDYRVAWAFFDGVE